MRHDEAFKLLIQSHPRDALEAFAGDLLEHWGDPSGATVENVELLPDLPGLERSHFLDVAMTFRWADGMRRILLLTEHFSHGEHVDIHRVHYYFAHLLHHQRGIDVYPVAVVGHGRPKPIPDQLTVDIAGRRFLDFRMRVFVITPAILELWQRTHNLVLAVLAACLKDLDPAHAGARSVRLAFASGARGEVLRAALPLIQSFGRITGEAYSTFCRLIQEDPAMNDIVAELEARAEARGVALGEALGEARGEARGRTEGRIETLLTLARADATSAVVARRQLRAWFDQGEISSDQFRDADAALEALG